MQISNLSNAEFMNVLKLVLEKRKSRKGRSKLPIDTFVDKWGNAKDLLEEINKKIHSKELLQEARSQYVISLVTGLEVFLKDTFIDLIDQYDFGLTELAKKKHINFDFIEIDYILKNKISMGELIVEYYNFQNLHGIQAAFSSLFEFDFFTELKRYKWYFDRKDPQGFVQVSKNFYPKINRLIKLRHNFVHDINPEINLKTHEIEDMHTELIVFASMIAFFIEELLANKLKQKAK